MKYLLNASLILAAEASSLPSLSAQEVSQIQEPDSTCKTSSDCKNIDRSLCIDKVCSPCTTNVQCRTLSRGERSKNPGLFFCDKPSGRCQGVFGDDDVTAYGNNKSNPILGTVNDHAIRNCPTANPLLPSDEPSVRKVSNDVHNREAGEDGMHPQKTANGESRIANSFAVFFGQYVDHDITLFGEQSGRDSTLEVDPLDDDEMQNLFLPKNILENGDKDKPEVEITSFIDASTIYGSDPWQLDILRLKPGKACHTLPLDICEPDCVIWTNFLGRKSCTAKRTCQIRFMNDGVCDEEFCQKQGDTCAPIPGYGVNGLLRSNRYNDDNDREMLPTKGTGGGACNGDTLESGDVRTGENTVLMAFHTLFFREHNRIAREFKKKNPTKNDKEVFQFARKLVRATFQKIIYEEWLPVFIGEGKLDYTGYDATVSPQIAMEFAGSAFRWGHSALPENVLVQGHPAIPLSNTFSNAKPLFNSFDALIAGVLAQPMEKVDGPCVEEVRNILFRNLHGQKGVIHPQGAEDLVTRNILRGRILELATFKEFYECKAYEPFLSKADRDATESLGVDTTPDILAQLNRAYNNNLDRVDLFTGMLAERRLPNGDADAGGFSKAIEATLVEQFKRLAHSDRFFYKNLQFTSQEKSYQSKDFAQLIRRVTGVFVQGDVFSIEELDLSSMTLPTTDCSAECKNKAECPDFCGEYGKCCRLGFKQAGCNHEREGISEGHRCVPNGILPSKNGVQINEDANQGDTRIDISGSKGEICPVTAGFLNELNRTCVNDEIVTDTATGEDVSGKSLCDNNERRGTKKCPPAMPVMCAQKTGRDNYCAKTEAHCKPYGGVLAHKDCVGEFDTCDNYACLPGTTPNFDASSFTCPARGCQNKHCCTGKPKAEIACNLKNCKEYAVDTKVTRGNCVLFEGTFWRSQNNHQKKCAPSENVAAWHKCGSVQIAADHADCGAHAVAGWCNVRDPWMEENCITACAAKAKEPPVDVDEDCYSIQNSCNKGNFYMELNCKKTCQDLLPETEPGNQRLLFDASKARVAHGDKEESTYGLLVWGIVSAIWTLISFGIIGFLGYLVMSKKKKSRTVPL